MARKGNIIAVSSYKGVFISLNNGNYWTKASNGLYNSDYVESLLFYGNKIFAATSSHGIYVSSNNGNNWSATNSQPQDLYILTLASDSNKIYAGTSSGLYYSLDSGNVWYKNSSLPNNTGVSSVIINGGNIYLGTYTGVYISTNNGTTWSSVSNGLTNPYVNVLACSANNIYAGTSGGVYITSNNGGNWTQVNSGLTNLDVRTLAVNDSNVFAGTHSDTQGGKVFYSSNNGNLWTEVNNGFSPYMNIYDISSVGGLIFSGNNILAALDNVYVSSNDGTNWSPLGGITAQATAFAQIGNDLYVGGEGGVYKTSNDGNDWLHIYSRGTSLAVKGSNIYAGASSGIFMSSNNGNNWSVLASGANFNVNCLASFNNRVFAGTSYDGGMNSTGTIYYSDNGTNFINSSGIWLTTIYSIEKFGPRLFASSAYSIYGSSNNGISWGSPWGSISGGANCMALCDNKIFAGNGHGVSVSSDSGNTWQLRNNGITNTNINAFAVSGGNIFAASTFPRNIYVSSNYGLSWTSVNEGLPDVQINALTIKGNNILVATYNGVWSRPLSQIYTKIKEEDNNNSFSIFPNPATSHITISNHNFSSSDKTTITIFNLSGEQMMFDLFEGKDHSEIDVSALSKGLYVVKIQNVSDMECKKLVIE